MSVVANIEAESGLVCFIRKGVLQVERAVPVRSAARDITPDRVVLVHASCSTPERVTGFEPVLYGLEDRPTTIILYPQT